MTCNFYPDAEWIPADKKKYRKGHNRTVTKIVLHETSGGSVDARRTARYFGDAPENSDGRVASAHYVVGRDGTVMQCVKNCDIAYHANNANSYTIGIEHNARAGIDTDLTDIQYENSAKLVIWLSDVFRIPLTRDYIVGHSEEDKKTTHSQCPQRALDWDKYMEAINKFRIDTSMKSKGNPAGNFQTLGS